MAQISNANLQSILDKIARHAAEANGDVLATAIATGGAYAVSSPNSGLSVANSDVLAALGSIDYWFVTEGRRVHKTVHQYLMRFLGGELSDEDLEVSEVAWVPLRDLPARLAYADERRLASLLPVAQDMADIRGISIRLVRFSTKEEVARIVPRPIELRSSHQDQPSEKKEPS